MLVLIDAIGGLVLHFSKRLGCATSFFAECTRTLLRTPLKIRKLIAQLYAIGAHSCAVICMVGAAIGCVMAYQSYIGLHRFGGEQYIGPVVFLSMLREFGPVLTGIMVAGKAGSAMTAEIGTMRITEQIDALQTLSINIHQYLVVPRIVAATIAVPLLCLFCSACGVLGGYFIAIHILKVNPELFVRSIRENVGLFDIMSGLLKATVFGLLLSWIACYKGYTTSGGARGVGKKTTECVVYSSVSIFLADYLLTALMF